MIKKIFKISLGILISFLLIIIGILLLENIEAFHGQLQNKKVYDPDKIPQEQTVLFLGDSITNGYMSKGGLDTEFQGYRGVVSEALKAQGGTTYNFAIGGYKVADVQDEITNNLTISDVNKLILEHTGDEQLKEVYPLDVQQNIAIQEAIQQADSIVITIGANDIIEKILTFDEDGTMHIDLKNINEKFKEIRNNKLQLYTTIHELNPEVKIYDVGIYFAYPHQSDLFMRIAYPLLMYAEHVIFINDKSLNVQKVTIRDNMQDKIKEYVDNPKDVHPSEAGHKVIANEVLKALES
ncbi:MAG: SGNH/GDSL hydrolase family protein [Mycoplasmatales bacterium]